MAYQEPANPDRLEDGPPPRPEEQTFGEEGYEDGELMKLPPREAAKRALELWESQDEIQKKNLAQWKVNRWRRKGIPGVQVIKDPDTKEVVAWAPPLAGSDRVPITNKAAQLCDRLTAVMFADPPVPEPVPATGEDEDVQSAETSGRILRDLDSESQLNDLSKSRRSFSRGCSYGSGWIHYSIDPYGGEYVPIEVEAGYEEGPITDEQGYPVPDETGQPQIGIVREAQTYEEAPQDPETGEDWPAYRQRFVRKDGTLTDEEAESARRYQRTIRSEVLNSPNVRLIPHTASDIWEAEGAQIATFVTWGELKRIAPELASLPKEDIEEIFKFRPDGAEDLLKGGVRKRDLALRRNKNEQLVFTLVTYYKKCPRYAKGLYLISLADRAVVVREPWVAEVAGQEEALEIPLTQFKQFDAGEDNTYGVSLMEYVGPGNEVRAAVLGSFLDHLERFGRRKMFLPTSSIIQPKQLQSPTYTVLPINPGGQPYFEEVPDYPRDGMQVFGLLSQEMETRVGLVSTEGLENPNASSGKQAATIVAQMHADLSELKQNTEKAITRGWRIKLQLARAFFDVPRLLRYQTDDKEYAVESWKGADLGSTRDVQMKVGSFTMLAPEQKAQLAEYYARLGMIPPEDLYDILAGNVGGSIGMQDDPVRTRVRRQIALWKKGPPPDWQGPRQQMQTLPDPVSGAPMEQPVFDAMGQPVMEVDPIWEPVPSDSLPRYAMIRLYELGKFMQTKEYMKWPKEWRAGLDLEFQNMMMASAPPAPVAPEEEGGGGDGGAPPKGESNSAVPATPAEPAQTPAPGMAA